MVKALLILPFIFCSIQAFAAENSTPQTEAKAPAISAPEATTTPAVATPEPQIEKKELTNRELIETLKMAVKPIELKEPNNDPVVIRYDPPRTTLNTSLGDPSVPSDLNLVVSKEGIPEQQQDILVQAYKAALLGQFEASLFLYKKALKNEPGNVSVLFGLGSLYQKLHQNEEAKSFYKKVLSIEPNHQKAVHNYIALIASDSPKNALTELGEIEKANPNFSPIQAQIGMVLANLGDYINAEKYLKRAIELSPEVVNYRYNLAIVYDHLGVYENAIVLYNQTLKFNTSDDPLPQSVEQIQARIIHLQGQLLKRREQQAINEKPSWIKAGG